MFCVVPSRGIIRKLGISESGAVDLPFVVAVDDPAARVTAADRPDR